MKQSLKENWKPLIFIGIVLVLTAISAYPQRKFVGRVTQVTDGKTCVIELPAGRLTAVLQFIEIPEPEQPLYDTVKAHLAALVLDKTVEFLPRGVMSDRTVGQLFVKNVDVSQQMLRDGAAWYAIEEKDSQAATESAVYADNESRARSEKRGVWSVENLKPAWEYRAEQAALRERQQREAYEKMRLAAITRGQNQIAVRRQTASTQVEMWADVGGNSQYDQPYSVGGLRTGYDPEKDIGFIYTPGIFLDFPGGGFLRKTESRIFYAYKGSKANVEDNVYVIGFLTSSKDYKFLKSNNLTIIADAQKINLGRARRFFRKDPGLVYELMVYKVTRAQLLKIAAAEKIAVQLGSYSGTISPDSLMYLNNLMNAT
jgi:endonuclease YncB( thermonuclease family)